MHCNTLNQTDYLEILKGAIAPAIGCTEPIAIAYAVAKAKTCLSGPVEHIDIHLSPNMMKNALGVGIPGTGMVGIDLAAALGAFGGNADAALEVLRDVTAEDIAAAKAFAPRHVRVALRDTPSKLYIKAVVKSGGEEASVVIRDRHTNIVRISRNGVSLYDSGEGEDAPDGVASSQEHLSVAGIFEFATTVPPDDLSFLEQVIKTNRTIANEGISGDYGLQVGKSFLPDAAPTGSYEDAANYAVGLSAAAADARMSGSRLPVMTVCGSGNQGITATVPVFALCEYLNIPKEQTLRALALSCLITIHVKRYIGSLSPICGCGLGSAIGSCAAATWLLGGTLRQVQYAIGNVIADVSGIICDGAKSGCALKIATVTTSAFRCAKLAMAGRYAGNLDGIVSEDVETSIRNIGRLGREGMVNADKVILDIMVCK